MRTPAYRLDQTFSERQASVGLFAEHYNKEPLSERAKYTGFSYFGTGGMIKDNRLITVCDNRSLLTENLDSMGEFSKFISMSSDELDIDRKSFLVSKKGEVVSYECRDNRSSVVLFEDTGLRLNADAQNLKESFSLAGVQYALLEDGSLISLSLEQNTLSVEALNMPVDNKNWVSATPISNPEIFN